FINRLAGKLENISNERVKQQLAAELDKARGIVEAINTETDPEKVASLKRDLVNLETEDYVRRELSFLRRTNKDVNDVAAQALVELQTRQQEYITVKNALLAKRRYAAFQKTLEITAARIPGQDYQ